MNSLLRTTCLTLLVLGTPAAGAQKNDGEAASAAVRESIDEILSLLQNEELSSQAQRKGVKDVIESMADLALLGRVGLDHPHPVHVLVDDRGHLRLA